MDTTTRERAPREEGSCAPTQPNEAPSEVEIEVEIDVPPSMWSLVSSHLGPDTETETDGETSTQLDPSLSPYEVEGDDIATGVGRIDPIRSRVTGRLIVAVLVVLSLSAGFTLVYLIG